MRNKDEIYQIIERFYDSGHGFHTLRFPDGHVIKGIFDMSHYYSHYKIPENLSGKTILDIGPGNGYFSFEFYKRGAEVTAIDKYPDYYWKEELNQLMEADVKFVDKDLETLDEDFGKFDIVFCSNALQHNADLLGNIKRIKKVTKKLAVLCTDIMDDARFNDIPLAHFVGVSKIDNGGKRWFSYWQPNMTCFKKIAEAAGFSKVEPISTFTIEAEEKQSISLDGVIHCYV